MIEFLGGSYEGLFERGGMNAQMLAVQGQKVSHLSMYVGNSQETNVLYRDIYGMLGSVEP